jgi:tetratricopeptide (TPR) repeat protein
MENLELHQELSRRLKAASDLCNENEGAGFHEFTYVFIDFPDNLAEVMLARHFVYLRQGWLIEALYDILYVIEIKQENEEKVEITHWFLASMTYLDLRKYKEAYDYVTKCIEQSIEENNQEFLDQFYLQAAFCQYQLGKIEKSRDYLSKVETDAVLLWGGEQEKLTKPFIKNLLDNA